MSCMKGEIGGGGIEDDSTRGSNTGKEKRGSIFRKGKNKNQKLAESGMSE